MKLYTAVKPCKKCGCFIRRMVTGKCQTCFEQRNPYYQTAENAKQRESLIRSEAQKRRWAAKRAEEALANPGPVALTRDEIRLRNAKKLVNKLPELPYTTYVENGVTIKVYPSQFVSVRDRRRELTYPNANIAL